MKWLTICRILIDGDRNRSFPSDLQYAIGRDNDIECLICLNCIIIQDGDIDTARRASNSVTR